ncbi:MAG TPA: DUF3515 domain-containing protein [Natronosporangium sp.]|nr:DUF3515 domain-containing protein [Natronosporangium sp.]
MDPVTRSAARLAALVAVPVAVLVGIGSLLLLGNAADSPSESPPSSAPAPVVTDPVEMSTRELTEWEEVVCRALLAQVPAEVDGLAQRPVTAGSEQNAAYGEPPITLECGVEAGYQLTDQVFPGSGVCWHATEQEDATVWVTLDREVPVRVTVPNHYDAPYQRVIEFSPVIIETIRSAEGPSGCDG